VDCVVPQICAQGATLAAENTAAAAAAATTAAPALLWLDSIITMLQHAMYVLTEQNKNGVPLVFLHAHDAWVLRHAESADSKYKNANNNSSGGDDDDDDSDVCVVVVNSPAAAKANPAPAAAEVVDLEALPLVDLTSPGRSPLKHSKPPPEIIEIL
jgi:hypothetical protein